MTNEILLELKERLEIISYSADEIMYIVDRIVEDDDNSDKTFDIKTITRLNRIERELEDCFNLMGF